MKQDGRWVGCGVLALGLVLSTSPAGAQSSDGTTLRQRLDDQRTDAQRTLGERSLERSNTELEQRRRILVRQRNSAIDSRRSVPIPPKTNRSTVVVNQ